MVRWFAVLTCVTLALAGCDSRTDSAEATEQQTAESDDDSAEQAADGETTSYSTATGLRFEAPSEWSVELMPAGARMAPEEAAKLREKYLLVIRFAPDDVDTATDGDYIDTLADDFSKHIDGSEVATREENLANPMGSGAYVGWNIDQEGWTKRVGFFLVIDDPWMLVLRQVGPLDRVESRRETLEQIFASAELTDAEIDERLVGTWRRGRPLETEDGTYHEKMTLESDGTLRLAHKPAGGSEDDTLEDLGRWAVREDGLVRYLGNQVRGNIQMQTNSWSLSDDERILSIEVGDETVRWERLE